MRGSRSISDWWLIAGSALLTSFSLVMPQITGIRSSRQWPIGAAVVLMIVWQAAMRKGLRISTLLASVCGISIGLLAAKLHWAIALKQPAKTASLIFSVVVITVTLFAFLKMRAKEVACEVESNKLPEEFDLERARILQLPPEEALQAVKTQFEEVTAESEKLIRKHQRQRPLVMLLVLAGAILTITTLPMAFTPERKPVQIALSVSILALIGAYFLIEFRSIYRERRDNFAESTGEDNVS